MTTLLLALALTTIQPDLGSYKAREADLEWWREARFGLFVHWGPVSLRGTEIGWSRGGERRDVGGKGEVPVAEYDSLYRKFNPTRFNADEWVRIAKSAGMRYLVFTSRHHDGFSNWDTQVSDYKITSRESPYRKDTVRQLAEACRKGGIRFGLYYSQPDWHHPDYMTDRHADYLTYMHAQVRELLSNYGKVDVLWFDGLGGGPERFGTDQLIPMVRKLQPSILVNDRCGWEGDFSTPEQRIGGYQTDRPWESCITIGSQWSYRPDETAKSLRECVRMLVRCAGGDGNLLLNVGPRPDGRIEPAQAKRLSEIGQWLRRHGESIYGTRGGPFKPGAWGASTRKGDRIWLHLLQPSGGGLRFALGSASLQSVRALTGSVQWRNEAGTLVIDRYMVDDDEPDLVIELKLNRPAAGLAAESLETRPTIQSASASETYQDSREFGPDKAFDGDEETRWATNSGTRAAWLEWQTITDGPFRAALIDEAYAGRVRDWELLAKKGETWVRVATGSKGLPQKAIAFDPTRSKQWRLHVIEASDGPTLREVLLLP